MIRYKKKFEEAISIGAEVVVVNKKDLLRMKGFNQTQWGLAPEGNFQYGVITKFDGRYYTIRYSNSRRKRYETELVAPNEITLMDEYREIVSGF